MAKAANPTVTPTCTGGVCNPQRTQGLIAQEIANGVHQLVKLKGPGIFLGFSVSKQAGANDLTFVDLDIDGRNVVNLSYAAAVNLHLTQANPSGIAVLGSGSLKTFTFGFPSPLVFKRELVLNVVVNETGVVQIVANVVHGS